MGIQNSHMPETGYIRLWRKAVEVTARAVVHHVGGPQPAHMVAREVEQPVAEILQQKEQQEAPEVQLDIE